MNLAVWLPEPGARPPDKVQAQYLGKGMGGYMLSEAGLPEGESWLTSIRLASWMVLFSCN